MFIKSSTCLRNDYGTISMLAQDTHEPIYITKNGEGDLVVMSIEAFEKREEILRLRNKIEAAEQFRLAGALAYTPEQSKARLEKIYGRKKA
jgi:prevent-host-death family protein